MLRRALLIRMFKEPEVLMQSVMASLRSQVWVGLLLLMLVFCCTTLPPCRMPSR